jgi:hypothetical protein
MEFLRISFGSLFQTRLDLTKYDLAYVDVLYSSSSNTMMPSVLLPDLVDLLVFFTFGTMFLSTYVMSVIILKNCTMSKYIYSYINTRGNWENSKLCESTPPFGRRVSTQFLVFPITTSVDIHTYIHTYILYCVP